MPALIPVLIGTAGWVTDEVYLLPDDGRDVVVGRSRSCTISLRRTKQYLNAPHSTRDTDHDFNTVSRKHIRIVVQNGIASVEDLSSNGTWCNDEPVHAPRSVDLNQAAATVRLGTREQFRLQLITADDPRVIGKQVSVASAVNGSAADD